MILEGILEITSTITENDDTQDNEFLFLFHQDMNLMLVCSTIFRFCFVQIEKCYY